MRRRYRIGGLLAAVLVVTTTLVVKSAPPTSRPGSSTDVSQSWPGWGFTHTQYSADTGDHTAVSSVQRALAAEPLVQVQAIMGWGADNPEPSPGQYDFASLDSRIDFIRRSGGIPVITLCGAPDWMKGGSPGQTDWSRLEDAPLPEHYADFASLSAVIAKRYPDVQHFIVWNELKGFWDEPGNTWDAAGYTDLYNQVYDAVKAANPEALIGGPYLPITSGTTHDGPGVIGSPAAGEALLLAGPWGLLDPRPLAAFQYWLEHKKAADFVVVDAHAATAWGDSDAFAAVRLFSTVNHWLRQQTDLPIWWAEWYLDAAVDRWPATRQIAAYTVAMAELVRSGTHTALYWNPRPRDDSCVTCLWTDTAEPGGGRPLPFLTEVLRNFARWFPPGTELRSIPAPAGVHILAQREAVVAVNTNRRQQTIEVDGADVTLGPYETRWLTS